MSFHRDNIRKARKEHKCDICNANIKTGENYHDKAGNCIHENMIYTSKECVECQPIIDEFCNSDSYERNEGYCDEWILEWWRDEKCHDCKHHYLPCVNNNCIDFFRSGGCDEKTKYGTCKAGDTCDDMTHYCRCTKFKKAD